MTFEAALAIVKALFGAVVVFASCRMAGRAIFGPLGAVRSMLTRVELELFSIAIGGAVLSQTIFLLGLVGLLYDATFLLLVAVSVSVWWRYGRQKEAGLPDFPGSFAGKALAAVPFLAFSLLYLPNALAPESAPDAVGYHLGLLSQYYHEHEIPAITSSVYAFLSQGAEMLFLFSYSFSRHAGPKLVHFALFLATLVALIALGKRLRFPLAGWVAAALYGVTSVVGADAVAAYNGCALAFFLVMLFYALAIWTANQTMEGSAILGALVGFSMAVKPTAVFAAAATGLYWLWTTLKDGDQKTAARALTALILPAIFLGLAWPARNAVIAGNPAAPFLNRVFENPHIGVRWEEEYREYFALYRRADERRGWIDYAELPLEATVRGVRHGGLIGPFFLAAPVLILLGWRRKLTPALLVAAAAALVPYLSNSGTRFLIPGLPFVCLAAALACERGRPAARALAAALMMAAHAATMWPSWTPLWRDGSDFWRPADPPWPVVTGAESRNNYLARTVPDFTLMQALEQTIPPGSRALALHAVAEAYYSGKVLISHDSRLGDELARELMMTIEPDFQPSRITRLKWNQQEITGVRLLQTATDERGWWSVSEVELLHEGEATAPPIDAEVEASIARWNQARLIDGDPLTIWRTWRLLEPSSIELTWSKPFFAEGLSVQAPWSQYYPVYQVELRTAEGQWREAEHWLEIERIGLDQAAVKERAYLALREEGIDAVAGRVDGGGHAMLLQHFEQDPAAWGFEEVWKVDSQRIYKLRR